MAIALTNKQINSLLSILSDEVPKVSPKPNATRTPSTKSGGSEKSSDSGFFYGAGPSTSKTSISNEPWSNSTTGTSRVHSTNKTNEPRPNSTTNTGKSPSGKPVNKPSSLKSQFERLSNMNIKQILDSLENSLTEGLFSDFFKNLKGDKSEEPKEVQKPSLRQVWNDLGNPDTVEDLTSMLIDAGIDIPKIKSAFSDIGVEVDISADGKVTPVTKPGVSAFDKMASDLETTASSKNNGITSMVSQLDKTRMSGSGPRVSGNLDNKRKASNDAGGFGNTDRLQSRLDSLLGKPAANDSTSPNDEPTSKSTQNLSNNVFGAMADTLKTSGKTSTKSKTKSTSTSAPKPVAKTAPKPVAKVEPNKIDPKAKRPATDVKGPSSTKPKSKV